MLRNNETSKECGGTHEKKLTHKQMAFVREYLLDFNATQAALRAGYSKNGIRTTASDLLANTNIKTAIENKIIQQEEGLTVTRDKVVQEIARLAFSDPRQFAEWNEKGLTLKNSSELGPNESACVESVSETKQGTSIRFHNKVKALELLAKHLGLFN